jgi:GMP synthase (glutamine-hydrolysing)
MNIIAIMAGAMDGPVESGWIGKVAEQRGATLHWFYRRLGDSLPTDIGAYDALIVFGGEVSVHDPELKPFFDELAVLILLFYAESKPVLGSCLGSQAIAYAFDAAVSPQGFLEYGFTPVTLLAEGRNDPLLAAMPGHIELFEMHSDTFQLPQQATLLMKGDAVTNQAFRIGHNIYAFQFHFEVTPEIVRTWTRRELIDNPAKDEQEVTRLFYQALADFDVYGEDQAWFARTLVHRWLDLITNTAIGAAIGADIGTGVGTDMSAVMDVDNESKTDSRTVIEDIGDEH